MTFANMLSITSNEFLSALIWIVLVLAMLYFARRPFHRAVGSFIKIFYNAMRLTSTFLLQAERRLVQRNREVLMAAGQEKAERIAEREFDRISTAVVRNLEIYPHIHRQLSEITTQLNEDYAKSADVPPSLPNWIPIIESISQIKHTGDSMVANMLAEINRTLAEQHKNATEAYRNSTASRHTILNKMLPRWRKVQRTLNHIAKSIAKLNDRAKSIDRYMDQYEKIRSQTDKAARMLSSSSLAKFFISGLFLLIATGGVIVNFNLIALPMSEMIGGASYIGPYKTADIFALVIILIELTMGLFLMESLRITRLFPIIGSMDDNLRRRIIWITLTMLAILAGVASALAFMGDRLAQDTESLRQTLAGVEQNAISTSMLPTVGKMILSFILPFALAFTAIPFESFIFSCRTVLGLVTAGLLRLIAFVLRLLGNVGYYIGRWVVNMYDLIIFPPIWLEGVILGIKNKRKATPDQQIRATTELVEDPIDNFDETIELRKPPE